MPIHDWTRVQAGTFHDFHQSWTIGLRNAFNTGVLPSGFFAMAEQIVSGPIPDIITLKRRGMPTQPPRGGLAVAEAPPKARFVAQALEQDIYTKKANRIVIRHEFGQVVAVIEIVSPGNKSSRHALRSFVEKACALLEQGIHLLIVDLFPPSARDPEGIHKAIWDEIREEPFALPADKPLTVAAYSAGMPKTAYVEPVAVGDALPDMPIFLEPDWYVLAPLEKTYQATWDVCPEPIREMLDQS